MFGSRRKVTALKLALDRMREERDDALGERDAALRVSRSADAWSQEAVAMAERHARSLRFVAKLLAEVGRLRRQQVSLQEMQRRDVALIAELREDLVEARRPVAGVVSPEVLRLRRDLRESRERGVALQDRLSETQRQNDLLCRAAVDRSGILAPAPEVAR
ncbi:hypothetical protein ACIQGZ_17500 [Streptomyces sp. NPDC092296]|uniref:hypothetical protein n=1 Tax=Streptomyces sp. NPDC092296 TaxID=3366012 RepID=UPI00381536EA